MASPTEPGPANASTIPELLGARARATPDRECLRFEGRSLSCAAVREGAEEIARTLRNGGVGPRDRVALMLPNGIDLPLAWLAAATVRAVSVPVHVGYGPRDLAHALRHSGAGVVLAGPGLRNAVAEVREACPELRSVGVLESGEVQLRARARGPLADRAGEATPDEPVTIQYTSGTTGPPKGCVLDHRYWLTLARTVQRYVELGPDDVIATAQPQSYMDPTWNLVLGLLAGVPLVVFPRFSASRFWADVKKEGITFFYCIGTMPVYLMKQPPDPATDRDHRVRIVYCSGIPPALHAAFEERWGAPWRETYGTTELGAVLLVPPGETSSVGSGSMGRPVPGRKVRVVDEDGHDVEPGSEGELLVRGTGLMRGYFRDPGATREWMPDGWARTGDLVAEDRHGYRLVGRKKDMIRRAGENVSAAEVEAVLLEHPRVRAAACVPVPDELRGEEVKAYLQLVEGGGEGPVEPASIRAFVEERLAPFKAPRYIEFVEEFPLTPSQKIAKAELVRTGTEATARAWDAERPGRRRAAAGDGPAPDVDDGGGTA